MNIRERCAALCAGWEMCLCGRCFPLICLPDVVAGAAVGVGSNLAPSSLPNFSRAGMPGGGLAGGGSRATQLWCRSRRRQICGGSPAWPQARRAINVIKDRIVGMRWRIQPRRGRVLEQIPDGPQRIRLTENFEAPNPDDLFRSLIEQVLEDVIVGGYGAIELDLVEGWRMPDGRRYAGATFSHACPVDGATIRIMTDWDGRPDSPRYAQVTGLSGAQGQIVLDDNELSYIRLNPRTHTPFGLGRLEVAFETINAFLSAYRYAGRLASNSVVQYALWLQGLNSGTSRAADSVVAGRD